MKFVQDHTVDSKAGFAARLPCDRFAALAVVGLDRLDDWCRPEAVAGMLVLEVRSGANSDSRHGTPCSVHA